MRARSIRPIVTALALLAGVEMGVAPTAFAQRVAAADTGAMPIDLRRAFEGPAFVYAGGDGQRVGVNDGIERAISAMNIVVRPIARGRLRERNPVYNSIAISLPSGFIEIAMPGRPLFRSPDDGTPVAWRGPDGGMYSLSQRFVNGHIVQDVSSRDGMRRNEFVLSADGRWLVMNVRITSPRLPAAVQYALTYRR